MASSTGQQLRNHTHVVFMREDPPFCNEDEGWPRESEAGGEPDFESEPKVQNTNHTLKTGKYSCVAWTSQHINGWLALWEAKGSSLSQFQVPFLGAELWPIALSVTLKLAIPVTTLSL